MQKLLKSLRRAPTSFKKQRGRFWSFGPRALEHYIEDKLHLEYCLELVRAFNLPVCATAHIKKKALEFGVIPDSTYDVIEIIHHLKFQDWKGVREEGNHDLVIFSGVRCDLVEQGLSTLKHFAPHLKTMALCRHSHPNADYALPILRPEQWKNYWDNLLMSITG